ncbi:MAG: hypothetical protein GF370_00985 [Candidatus Nealsonbacteria bacterium]|nr:hypothetical protein [Candidatus Nealsonbacteria bacterium]
MKKIIFAAVSSAILLSALPALAETELIANGGFEEPIVGAPEQWDIYVTSEVPGWNIEWRSGLPTEHNKFQRPDPKLELHAGVNGWMAKEGDQYAELDTDWDGPGGSLNNEPASVKIYQDIPTADGEEYTLSFSFSPRPGTPAGDNVLEIWWDGVMVDSLSRAGNSQTDWSDHQYVRTATGPTTRVAFIDMGTANSLGTFLDDVSVIYEEEEPGDQIDEGNCVEVKNFQVAVSNTGFNGIANSRAGEGESETDDNDGNQIFTSQAWAETHSFTVANSNIKRGCCEGIQVNVGNRASVMNVQVSRANTGFNGIANSRSFGDDSKSEDNDNNVILTGPAVSKAHAFTMVNTNLSRGLDFDWPER